MVSPWIIGANNGPADFLNYAANGFTPVTYDVTNTTATYAAGTWNFDGTTGGKIAVITAANVADVTLSDDPILYALKSERTITVSGANDTITLRSGGLSLRNLTDNTSLLINPAIVAHDGTAN